MLAFVTTPAPSKGGPGCCCSPNTIQPCTRDHQGTTSHNLMNFYHWRVAILSNHRVVIVTNLMLILLSCANSLSFSKSQ
ncbi:hypothetical protein SLEP1_g3154 [Rubroshorea leprosula]|uniref:Uncharacterized protein n=1 Tax=Rubroshorea leprosula TaxID=152421 RepID=A0AAV5HTT6_9ROSI|nr:hypothetical protein SLEP1_g3154 [Rubroshorea leprosula]